MGNRFDNKTKIENKIDDIIDAGKTINSSNKIETKNETKNKNKGIITIEPKEKDEMIRVSFYIKKSQADLIKNFAKKTNRNKNEFVRFMIDKFFEVLEIKN
ncbi:MAG: hypothetical protein GX309_13340 [Clostridiales bacterium]|nr:hypothetical protein [Clostridiales bacterium]